MPIRTIERTPAERGAESSFLTTTKWKGGDVVLTVISG